MKLTIKTLQQFTFKLDIDDGKTVKELKEQIEHNHGKDYPIAHQKLIYNGKILADESKLVEYDIDEKKFVVLMITRPPPPPKVQQPVDKTSSSTTGKKEEANKQKLKPDDKRSQPKTTGPTTTTTTTTSSTPTSHPSASSLAPASASPVPTNPAATPTNLSTATTTTTTSSLQNAAHRPVPAAGRTGESNTGSEQSYMSSRLASIMNQPGFRQIQELIQQSPHLISSTIEGLSSSDPDMYNFISENPDIFVGALNQPMSLNLSPSSRSSTSGSGAGGGGQLQSNRNMRDLQQGVRNLASGARQQVETINVSERDREAIERLKELGFTEIQAYQAYIACDKDEQLAANLLFQMEQ